MLWFRDSCSVELLTGSGDQVGGDMMWPLQSSSYLSCLTREVDQEAIQNFIENALGHSAVN
jgi:hypothetical protein